MSLDLALLCASLLAWGLGEGMFFIFQPIYLHQLGANTLTIAVVLSLFGLAMVVVHIPAGHLSDRLGRKPLLLASWITGVLATGIMAMARSLPVFIAGLLLYGLTAFVSSPLNSYITAAQGRLSLARAMTLVTAAYNLGAVLGPVTGGWIGGHYGLRSVYLVSTCIFVLSTIVMVFLRSQPRLEHDPAAPPGSLHRNVLFVRLLGISFLVMFAMYLPQAFTPNYLQFVRGVSLENIGLLGSAGSLGNALIALALGLLAARTGFLLSQLAVAAFAILLWKGSGLGWYALGYFLLGGYRSARSLVFAQIRPLIHPARMGLAYGTAETFNSLAVTLAPLLAGVLYSIDPAMVYWASAIAIGLMILVSLLFTPREASLSKPTFMLDGRDP